MPSFATIYMPNDFPDIDLICKRSGVSYAKFTKPDSSQLKVLFLELEITFNFMSKEDIKKHLAGFSNYLLSLHQKNLSDATHSILERLVITQNVVGCVIEPGFDDQAFAGGFLTSITNYSCGFLYAKNSIFDSDGTVLIEV